MLNKFGVWIAHAISGTSLRNTFNYDSIHNCFPILKQNNFQAVKFANRFISTLKSPWQSTQSVIYIFKKNINE